MIDTIDLEWRARGILGWDGPEAKARAGSLTDEERAFMLRDAYSLDPAYPPHRAPADDEGLSRWWLGALRSYVESL